MNKAFVLALMLTLSASEVAFSDDAFDAPTSSENTIALERPNVVSVEGLGRGYLYSVDFDHAFSNYIAVGAGFSYWDTSAWWRGANTSIFVIPVYGNFYFSPGSNRVYFTAGADFVQTGKAVDSKNNFKRSGVVVVLGGGYELRTANGLLFRSTPYVFLGKSINVGLGLSAGVTF